MRNLLRRLDRGLDTLSDKHRLLLGQVVVALCVIATIYAIIH